MASLNLRVRLVNACKLLVTLHNKCAACLHYKCTIYTIYIHMVFITEGFFEVAIESWPEWDLAP